MLAVVVGVVPLGALWLAAALIVQILEGNAFGSSVDWRAPTVVTAAAASALVLGLHRAARLQIGEDSAILGWSRLKRSEVRVVAQSDRFVMARSASEAIANTAYGHQEDDVRQFAEFAGAQYWNERCVVVEAPHGRLRDDSSLHVRVDVDPGEHSRVEVAIVDRVIGRYRGPLAERLVGSWAREDLEDRPEASIDVGDVVGDRLILLLRSDTQLLDLSSVEAWIEPCDAGADE